MDNNLDSPLSQPISERTPNSTNTIEPVDILELGYDPNYLQTVDDEYLDMVTTIAPYMPASNYNPGGIESAVKPQFSTDDWFSANTVFDKPKQRDVKPRQAFSIRDTNFDRFYNHPKFSQLGFNPYRDNDSYYNENSTWGDNWSRMWTQFANNFEPGFTMFGLVGNEGIGNMFNLDPDAEDAVKMAEAMRIGNDTSGGFGASVTNFTLNSAYSLSIMASIAAEELAMWGATAALAAATPFTGGTSGAAAVATGAAATARTATNAAKFSRMLARLGDATAVGRAFKGGRSMIQALRATDGARDFWTAAKTGKNTLGRIFLPETMQALRTFEATKDAGNAMVKLGRGSAAFGGFYRDLRMIDLALDESRLEAGFVYNDMISNGVAAKRLEIGGDNLTEKDLQDIQNSAVEASTKTLLANAPVIYLTNRISLGATISPFSRGIRRVLDTQTGRLGKKLIQTKKAVKNGKIQKDLVEKKKSIFTKEGRRQRRNAYDFGDYATKGAHGALRFFAANLSEGFQELYQEALQVGVIDYHVELLKDPAANKKLLFDAAMDKSIESQMSAQGFETFMSGFATGGILGGGSKLIYNVVPNTYNKVFNKEEFKTQREAKEKALDDLVTAINTNLNMQAEKGQSILDTNNNAFIKAKQGAEEMRNAAYGDRILEFKDEQDFIEFNQLENIIANGMADTLRGQLKGILTLTDAELIEAYPEYAKEVKNGKLRKRYQDLIDKSYELEDIYNKERDDNPNPFDFKQHDPLSREYREELALYNAWEHARYLKMFTKQAFNDSQKRMQSIFDGLLADNIVYTRGKGGDEKQSINISKLSASDLTVLLDPNSLRSEIRLLQREIDGLEGTDQLDALEKKKLKKELLEEFLNKLTDPKNQNKTKSKDGLSRFNKSKINQLEGAFVKYIEFLAESNAAFADKAKVKDVLKKIVDYGELQYRTKMYDKAVELMSNPSVMDEIRDRAYRFYKEEFNSNRDKLRQRLKLKDAINQDEVAQVLKDLDDAGIIPDPDEAEDFLQTGDINALQTFMTEYGPLNPAQDPGKFITIARIQNNYIKLTEPDQAVEDDAIEDSVKQDMADEEKAATVINSDNTLNPYAKSILVKVYQQDKAIALQTTGKVITLEEWQKTEKAKQLAVVLKELKSLWVGSLDKTQDSKELGKQIKTDRGFNEWIQANQDNPDVRELVIGMGEPLGINFDVLAGKNTTQDASVDKKDIIDQKAGIRVRKTTVTIAGKKQTRYIIEYANGAPITEEVFAAAGIDQSNIKGSYTAKEYRNIFKKLVNIIPDTDSFDFGIGTKKRSIKYGDIITDKDGKRFVVLGTPSKVSENGTLFILPEDQVDKYKTTKAREKAAKRISAKEFADYTVETESFADTLVSKDMPRIGVPNILAPYTMSDDMSDEDTAAALAIILKELKQEELDLINIVVTKRPSNKSRTALKDNKTGLVNTRVDFTRESHSFKIVFDPTLQGRINTILKENEFADDFPLDKFSIQLPSGNIAFKDESGNDIDNIFAFPESKLSQFFRNPSAALRALAKQQLLRKRIFDALAEKDGEGTIKLTEVVDDVRIALSYSNIYGKNTSNNLEDFKYNTYEGEQVIIDYSYRLDPQTKTRNRLLTVITNYPVGSDQDKALRRKVLKELKDKTLSNGTTLLDYLKTTRKTDRYHAVIKTPNGNIVFAPLKASQLDIETQEKVLNSIVEQSEKTVEDNIKKVDGDDVVQDLAFNDDFNKGLEEDMYISLRQGYNAELKVTSKGAIELKIIDTTKDKKVTSFFVDANQVNKIESLEELASEFGKAIAKDKDTKKLKLEFGIESFKKNIPAKTTAQGIALLTKTNLNLEVFDNTYLQYDINSDEIGTYIESERAKDQIVDEDSNTKPDGKKAMEILNEQMENESDVNSMTQEEFDDHVSTDFENLSKNDFKSIAIKLAKNSDVSKLSEREQLVYKVHSARIELQKDLLNESTNVSDEYTKALSERDEAKTNLETYVGELKSKVDDGSMTVAEFTMATAGKQDAEYVRLKTELDKKERVVNSFAGKIMPADFTGKDAQAIEEFIEWAQANLPDFITIRNIEEIANRLKVNGIPVGAFVTDLKSLSGGIATGGTIYVGDKGFRYHEAFHSVFRLLLTPEEQKQYLAIARKEVRAKLRREGKDFKQELDKFRNSADKYKRMSDSALEQEYYEEYLADQFELFKSNPRSTKTDSIIKSFFNRLIEWIKNVFGSFNKGEMQRLFENIDAGKYKGAGIQNNVYTNGSATGVALDAYKILTYDKVELETGFADKYIDPVTANKLIGTITSVYLNRVYSTDKKVLEKIKGKSREEVLFDILNDFKELYNPLGEHNSNRSGDQAEKIVKLYKALGGTLDNTTKALTEAAEYQGRAKDAVVTYLTLFDSKIEDEEYQRKEIENDQGLRNTSQWDLDQSMIGGFSNLPMALRAFIATTQVEATDEFGNTELLSGETIYTTVDYSSAYNGILKSVKNTTDPVQILRSLVSFASGNTQTKAVVEKMFNKLGGERLTMDFVMNGKLNEETGKYEPATDEQIIEAIDKKIFFNELIKGFENFRVDYLFIHKNTQRKKNDQKETKILLYNASNRDDASNQIDVWKQSHNERFKVLRDSEYELNRAVDAIESLYKYIDPAQEVGAMTAQEVFEEATKISNDIYETVGIRLSPAYIQFTIASGFETLEDVYLQSLVDSNKNAEPIELDTLEELVNQLQLNKERGRTSAYLFNKKGGIKSRLQTLAKNNSLFDETIGQSVFLNPEGNFVYAHQKQTLHLKMISKMNDDEFLQELENNNEGYNLGNLLLSNPAFMQLSKEDRLSILRVAGTKESSIGETNDSALDLDGGIALDKNGKTYGSLTGAEFTASLINAYLTNYQTLKQENKTVEFVDPETNEVLETAIAPVLIRVIEASNTGDMINLPVIKTVEFDEKGQVAITKNATDLYIEEIRREFKRIQREAAKDITEKTPIDGYNASNGNVSENYEGRAYKFNDTATLLESSTIGQTQVESIDLQLTKDTTDRVLDNTQKTIYTSEAQARTIGITLKGTTSRVEVISTKTQETFYAKALGQIKVTEENIAEVVKSLGSAVQKEKSSTFKYKVTVGDVTLYTDTIVMQKFLKGKSTRFGYELIKVDEFREDVNQSVEFDFKSDLEKYAIENPEASLEDAINSLNEDSMTMQTFRDVINERLIQEYDRFAQDLQNFDVFSSISSDVLQGITNDDGLAQGDAAMQQLNLVRDNERYNLMQIFFNDWLNTKAINQLILGDQSISLKDAVDKVKRAKMQNASHKSAGTPVFEPKLGVMHATDNISHVAFTDETFNKKYSKDAKPGERADAQMYITTKALRHMLFGFAELDARKAELIDRLEAGEKISAEELLGAEGYIKNGAVFNSLKLVYGDGQTFLKMSAVVLTPELTTREDGTPKPQFEKLHNLRLKLEKIEEAGDETIAIASPLSASKMKKQNTLSNQDVFSEFNPEADPLVSNNLKAEFMGLQLVNPSNKVVITDPTQMKALITSEMDDSVEVTIKAFGEEKTLSIGRVKELYHQASANRLNLKYFGKVNLIANFSLEGAMNELSTSIKQGQLTIELKEFLTFAQESLKASQATSNTIEFFNPEKNFDLNNQMVIDKFEQLFLSFFTKETISEKIPGVSLALASDSGVGIVRRVFSVDENGNPDKHEIIRSDYYNSQANPEAIQIRVDAEGNLIGLADAIERSNGKGVIVLDDLRHNLKEYDSEGNFTGQRYSEGMMPAHFREIMEDFVGTNKEMPDFLQKAFAVRIPSQDKHSAYATKFVDFLPTFYGSTAIFSKELIEISGADFDIDKVYTHIKEWYRNEFGEYIEYGDLSRTDQEQFEDYIHYVADKSTSRKSIYYKAAEKTKYQSLESYQRYTTEELELFEENTGLKERQLIALKVLGLPTTLEEFVKHRKTKGQPYEAALNNQILDHKFALWSNTGITESKDGSNPIAYDPAVLDPLTTVETFIKENLPELAELSNEDGLDVDNLLGKFRAFSNNKEGAASIGAAVLPNLYLNLLGENEIKIRSKVVSGQTIRQISFNGIDYNEFSQRFEKKRVNGEEVEGDRTQFIISALITAMTDNAKERLAAKLGLNRDALSVVTTLTKLGVPIKTSILLVNNPIIRKEYFFSTRRTSASDPGIAKRIADVLEILRANYEGIELTKVVVTDQMLINQAKDPSFGEDLSQLEYEDAVATYNILKQFITAHDLKSFVGKLSSVMNLSKGFGRTFTDLESKVEDINSLGIGLSDSEFNKARFKGMPLPIDVRPLFKKDIYQANQIKVLDHFVRTILPNIFTSRTPLFAKMKQGVLENMTNNTYVMDVETKEKVAKDLLSFLNIKAYMNMLEKRGSQMSLASLNNAFVYPQSNAALNIHGLVEQLREEYPDNFFLNNFMFNENARELDNSAGIHLLQSNTFGKKSDIDKIRIQADFMELFSNNRMEAMHILHYMMVKDGLQFGTGSLLDAVTPDVLGGFSIATEDVFNTMRSGNSKTFESRFGSTYSELLNEFVLGYLQSNKNNILLQRLNNVPIYDQIFEETEVLNGAVTEKLVAKNPDKIYVFAENQRRIGTTGSSRVRGMDNALPLTLMYDLTTFYDIDDLNSFVERFDQEIEEIKNTGKRIVFPKELLSKKEVNKLKRTSKEIFNYIDEKLSQEFGYSLSSGILLEDRSVSKRALATKPMAMDFSRDNKELVIDVYKGVKRLVRSDESQVKRVVKGKLSSKQVRKLMSNLSLLNRQGIEIVEGTKIDGTETKLVKLPAVIKVVTGKKNKTVRYFRLKETYSPLSNKQEIVNVEEGISIGSAGVYELIETKGSNYQNGLGFMFDNTNFERPSYNTIKDFLERLQTEGGFIDESLIGLSEEKNSLVKLATDYGYDIVYQGNELFVDLATFKESVERNLVSIKDLTEQMLEENDYDGAVDEFSDVETIPTEPENTNANTEGAPAIGIDLFSNMEEVDLEAEYPTIVEFWNNNIEANPEALARLREQNILTLEDFIMERNDPDMDYADDETFLDKINSCIL